MVANLLERRKERTVINMRNIFTVNATQVVISESNPQGVLSNVTNYPMPFDSRNYKATAKNPNGDEEIALLAAQAEYSQIVQTIYWTH